MLIIKKINNKEKGFSLGEVLLSVFILGVVMVTIMMVFSNSLRELMDERDNIIAIMLAQEGVELARNIRDNNWADRSGPGDTAPADFDNFHNTDNDSCRVDIDATNITSCGNSTNHKQLYLNGNNFYIHDGSGTATEFKRQINLDYDGDNLIVTSYVTWNNASLPTSKINCTVSSKCVFSETTLSKWGTGL
jgi:Tfp pilus assembly protein PilV